MKIGVDKPENEKIEIPQTGVESYILLGVLVLIAGIALYRRLQEKGLFRRL
jgi:LPXTG-motif cell wall-anchored protein